MAEERGAPVVPASKLRIEMEEDAEAEARSLASFAVEDSARFWEVTRRNARTPDLQALPPKKKCMAYMRMVSWLLPEHGLVLSDSYETGVAYWNDGGVLAWN